MSQILFLEAFGPLSRDTSLAGMVSEAEDLYSVFNTRAELMSWATTATQRRRVELWEMNEADLTAGTGESRIGWVQVGLGEVVEPGPWICRRRSKVIRHSPYSDEAPSNHLWCWRRWSSDSMTRSCLGDLVGVLNWFNTTQKAEQMRSSPLTKSCLGAILRQSSSPVSSGGTPDRSSSDRW